MAASKGWFRSLFDFSFSSLVTTKIIKLIYGITMVVIALTAVFLIVSAFASSGALGAVMLIVVAPLFALLSLVYARVTLEFFITIFRIMENGRDLLELTRAQQPALTPSPADAPPAG